MAFTMTPLSRVLNQTDFIISVIGFAFVLIGVFFAIESLARSR